MEPEVEPPLSPVLTSQSTPELKPEPGTPDADPETPQERGLDWVFLGSQGLRAGWSVAIFASSIYLLVRVVGTIFATLHLIGGRRGFTATSAIFDELAWFLAMLGSAWIVSRIEQRRILDYNLTGPHRPVRFASGMLAGFAALSALVGALSWGGWLHFGPVALSGPQILSYAALWGCAFLLVACVEEGTMRCFLLFTLARGINFWWAVGLVAAMCADVLIRTKGNGAWGVYALALAGVVPCLALFLKKTPEAGFWYAAWVTSTFFGFGHTGNRGENWIGIFAAGAIGFVFCVSVKVTGSAWWAIGCHAAWDWAETYFYGTADSGMAAKGHYFTTSPAGAALWSGGADGPEGSVLVLAAILLLLAVVLALYGRRKPAALPVPVLEQAAG
jgi:uncharacterized protein